MADKILQFITVDEWILKVSRQLIIRFIILRRVNCWAAMCAILILRKVIILYIIPWKIMPWETKYIGLTSRYAAACAIKQYTDERQQGTNSATFTRCDFRILTHPSLEIFAPAARISVVFVQLKLAGEILDTQREKILITASVYKKSIIFFFLGYIYFSCYASLDLYDAN